jgi:hypothetical protein
VALTKFHAVGDGRDRTRGRVQRSVHEIRVATTSIIPDGNQILMKEINL